MTHAHPRARTRPALAAQLHHLAQVAEPGLLGQLKLDLVVWGTCYLTPTGGRINPPDAAVLFTRPLTELTGPDQLDGPVTGWFLVEERA